VGLRRHGRCVGLLSKSVNRGQAGPPGGSPDESLHSRHALSRRSRNQAGSNPQVAFLPRSTRRNCSVSPQATLRARRGLRRETTLRRRRCLRRCVRLVNPMVAFCLPRRERQVFAKSVKSERIRHHRARGIAPTSPAPGVSPRDPPVNPRVHPKPLPKAADFHPFGGGQRVGGDGMYARPRGAAPCGESRRTRPIGR